MWQYRTKEWALAFLASWIFMWFVIVVVMCCGCCGPAYPHEYTQYTSGVRITVQCIDGTDHITGWYGSGVIISRKTLLTAGHVAPSSSDKICSILATDSFGGDHNMIVGFVDTDHDIASMHVIDVPFRANPIQYGIVPMPGSDICADVGFPDRIHRCGKVKGWWQGWVTSSVVVEPGNSGSGVYDSAGRLIGIVVHYVKSEDGVYYGSHFTPIANLIHHLPELLKE